MTPRGERDPSLPSLPENSEAKLSSDWSECKMTLKSSYYLILLF